MCNLASKQYQLHTGLNEVSEMIFGFTKNDIKLLTDAVKKNRVTLTFYSTMKLYSLRAEHMSSHKLDSMVVSLTHYIILSHTKHDMMLMMVSCIPRISNTTTLTPRHPLLTIPPQLK